MTNLDHIQSLIRHGAQLRGEDGSLTEEEVKAPAPIKKRYR